MRYRIEDVKEHYRFGVAQPHERTSELLGNPGAEECRSSVMLESLLYVDLPLTYVVAARTKFRDNC